MLLHTVLLLVCWSVSLPDQFSSFASHPVIFVPLSNNVCAYIMLNCTNIIYTELHYTNTPYFTSSWSSDILVPLVMASNACCCRTTCCSYTNGKTITRHANTVRLTTYCSYTNSNTYYHTTCCSYTNSNTYYHTTCCSYTNSNTYYHTTCCSYTNSKTITHVVATPTVRLSHML